MPEHCAFEYAILRVVPCVEREEFINAGVVLRCRERRFLAARVHLDRHRLRALAPSLDLAELEKQLRLVPLIAAGGPEAGAIGVLPQAERFRWLTSPRSTMVQVSPVHSGLCENPQAALDDLLRRMVKGEAPCSAQQDGSASG